MNDDAGYLLLGLEESQENISLWIAQEMMWSIPLSSYCALLMDGLESVVPWHPSLSLPKLSNSKKGFLFIKSTAALRTTWKKGNMNNGEIMSPFLACHHQLMMSPILWMNPPTHITSLVLLLSKEKLSSEKTWSLTLNKN